MTIKGAAHVACGNNRRQKKPLAWWLLLCLHAKGIHCAFCSLRGSHGGNQLPELTSENWLEHTLKQEVGQGNAPSAAPVCDAPPHPPLQVMECLSALNSIISGKKGTMWPRTSLSIVTLTRGERTDEEPGGEMKGMFVEEQEGVWSNTERREVRRVRWRQRI